MISSNDKNGEGGNVGPKALRLQELSDAGYPVPPFVVITAEEIQQACRSGLDCDPDLVAKLVTEIIEKLPGEEYAVRSAMKIEDLGSSSQAGQFKTALKVVPADLPKSIRSVIDDARKKLSRGLVDCSIIVQTYIEPDYAGVIFTRNPLFGREMVVEYRQGVGDKVVGGEEVTKIQCLPGDIKNYIQALPNLERLAAMAYAIEEMYDCPQDIEWATREGSTYILQARPVTSITKAMWQGLALAESELSGKDKFYFEKTGLSETFTTPRPLSMSILEKLHTEGGAVDLAYKNLGVRYSANENLFRTFGNDLFTNRHIEIKTLFPAFGYKKSTTEKPVWETWDGTLATLKNIWSLWRMSLTQHVEQERRLVALESTLGEDGLSLEESFDLLTSHYATIFEVNIFAQKALLNIERLLGKDTRYLSGLLARNNGVEIPYEIKTYEALLRGNSLNIDDITPFVSASHLTTDQEGNDDLDKWWESLPKWRQVGLTSHLTYARKYMALREFARVLSVRLISHVRNAAEKRGLELFPDTPSLVYFLTIDELLEGNINRDLCEERRRTYEQNTSLVMPSYLASFVKSNKKTTGSVGISPGRAEGTFVTKATMSTVSGKKILYTEVLSPDLVQYFGDIEGIVSKNGGMLSHLAIMARESQIPVVVTNGSIEVPLGRVGHIDGLSGEVRVM